MSESTPLQKGSKNPPPKPHGIKGRIHPIRLFHNVWVEKRRRAGNSCVDHNSSAVSAHHSTARYLFVDGPEVAIEPIEHSLYQLRVLLRHIVWRLQNDVLLIFLRSAERVEQRILRQFQ
jgi:hypothetical protein